MRTIFLLSLSLAISAGETNNIHGTVLDPSGRPVEGARVACPNQAVFTNVEGRFALQNIDRCDARIEKDGFTPQTVSLASSSENKVALAVAGPNDSVVVSAIRTETTPEQAAVAATVISSEKLQALNYPMLFEILPDVPGLQVDQYGGPGALAQVFTRGAERTGTLVLVDGVPLNDPGGELHLEHLTSDDIDHVEVIRGPESALFGAEAAAAVIQIFTKRGDPEDHIPHGSFSYERGAFQTDRWTANLNGGLAGRFDYSLNASQFHTAGNFQNTFDRDTTGTVNLGYKISNSTQVRGVFNIYDGHDGTPGQTAYGVDDPIPNEETRDSTVSVRVDDSRGANYSQVFTFGYHRLSDQYNDNEPYGEQPLAALVRNVAGPVPEVYLVSLLNPNALPTQIPAGLQLVQSDAFFGPSSSLNITERKMAGYQGTWRHKGGVIVFGYDYQKQSGNLSGILASRDNNGWFFNVQQDVGSRIFLSGGARFEHSSAFGNIGVGRGGGGVILAREHGALSSASLRLSAGRGVTEPSLLEQYGDPPYYFGNPTLVPEQTTSYEAGFVTEWFGRRVKTDVALFRSSFDNLIAFVGDTWENIQASWARGVETSIEARLPHHILINASYMRLYTRVTASTSPESSDTGIGEELVHRPRNSGAVSIALTPKRWSFVAGGRLIGERQDADFTFGITRNPGYENVYASASYQATRHITPYLRADNILNEYYTVVLGYQALSRNISGGLRIHW
jgi:vitamin B12 transporter